MFIQVDRLSRFLRFTVEATLAEEADMLKVYLIGTRYTTQGSISSQCSLNCSQRGSQAPQQVEGILRICW